MTDETDRCPICLAQNHHQAWRCESCGAEFGCPTAIVAAALEAPVMQHRALPIMGGRLDSEGNGPFPIVGDEVLCGPVELGGVTTKTKRGIDLAQAQARRSALRVVAIDDPAEGDRVVQG